jgi:hypothetical protein
MKILILEISDSKGFCMQQTLGKLGHDVFVACDIKEAEKIRKDNEIDCIISCTNMYLHDLKDDEEKKQADYGPLAGLVLLQNYVFMDNPTMIMRTIMFTKYLSMDVVAEALKQDSLEKLTVIPRPIPFNEGSLRSVACWRK